MAQISFRVEPVGLGGFQNGKDDHAGIGPGLGIAEEPVFPTDHNGADRVLHLVVADFNLAVVEERAKVLPLVQGGGNGFLQLAGRAEDGFQPGVVRIHNGSGKKLALLPAGRVMTRSPWRMVMHEPMVSISSLGMVSGLIRISKQA